MKKTVPYACLAVFGVSALMGCGSKKSLPPSPPPAPIYEVSAPGENFVSLTQVTSSEKCYFANGGDNEKNLFYIVYDGIYSNIYRKNNITDGAQYAVTQGQNKHSTPSYCAATNQLFFDGKPQGNNVSDIYMTNATSGGALTQITQTPDYEEHHPCVNKAGTMLVYEKKRRGAANRDTQIWIKNLRTNENSMLCVGLNPSFSPDGSKIAFVKYPNSGNSTILCVMNSDGTNQMQLTGSGNVWHPRFSPDGTQIVCQWSKGQGKNDYDIWIIGLNGSFPEQMTMNESYDGEPFWASDGNIFFTSDRGGRRGEHQIWKFRKGGTKDGGGTPPTSPRIHVVQRGETITDIARRYNITVKNIVQWNDMKTMTITPGMQLKVCAQ